MSNLFILGAGFSKPAGFPLGMELYKKIIELSNHKYSRFNAFKYDLERYTKFLEVTTDDIVGSENLDIEKLIEFLDIEHFFDLQGSDTLTDSGNASQHLIRNMISDILFSQLEKSRGMELEVYEKFVSLLKPNDIILTFNYDSLLESIFDKHQIPYRLFPLRFKDDNHPRLVSGLSVDYNDKEIIYLKMHGSSDWFDKTDYLQLVDAYKQYQSSPPEESGDFVFAFPNTFNPQPIIKGYYPPESYLNNIYRVENLRSYFNPEQNPRFALNSPFILAPSNVKMLYANPFIEFWSGLPKKGRYLESINIIGYSLPAHDMYIRQAFYSLFRFYEKYKSEGGQPIKIIDFRGDNKQLDGLKKNWNILNKIDHDFYINGFDENSLDFIFG